MLGTDITAETKAETKAETLKIQWKFPIYFTLISLIFIYVFQYPLSLLIGGDIISNRYGLLDWVNAYVFVIVSIIFLTLFLYIGLDGQGTKIHKTFSVNILTKRIKFPLVIFIAILFLSWSYLMLKLKIGMTIYADFDPLPFRLTGLLFYGRLLLQPIILSYICYNYKTSKAKSIIFIIIFAIGLYASLTSGSRFLGVMFALPFFLLFKGKSQYIISGLMILIYITVASLTRHFFLPFYISDLYIKIYAAEGYQAAVLGNGFMLPVNYLIGRSMGIAELLMTLRIGDICPTFFDSLLKFLSAFLPFVPEASSISIKNIYGLSDDTFGGLGLDLFSNLWFVFGGSLILYLIGLSLVGLIIGRCYSLLYTTGLRFGFKDLSIIGFIFLFLLVFEGRTYLLIYILIGVWFASLNYIPRILHSIKKSLFLMISNNIYE